MNDTHQSSAALGTCDQHLLAEHRELTRIPNTIARGKFSLDGQPSEYKLGAGHVKFFFDKLTFLQRRYALLHAECLARGFNVTNNWPDDLPSDANLWRDYEATEQALSIKADPKVMQLKHAANHQAEALRSQ